MSLLKITTTPIEYEIKVERAKLQSKEPDVIDSGNYNRQVRNSQRINNVPTDAAKLRQINDSQKQANNYQNVARGRVSGNAKTTAAGSIISNSTSVAQSLSSTSAPFSAYENAQAMSGVETSYDKQIDFASDFSQINTTVNADMFVSSVSLENVVNNNNDFWTVSKNEMEYVPGRFKMDIIQYPKVNIEYVGEIHYFPESASPENKNVE